MAASITDLFAKASNGTAPVPTTLSAQKLNGATSATITLSTGWPTDTAIHFILYQVDANNNMVAGTETLWKGILSGTTISSLTLRSGTDTTYPAGSVVQMAPTSAWADDFVTGMIAEHNQLGIHQKINGNTVPAGTANVVTDTASQTLTNKVLTSPTISTPSITTRFDGWTSGLPTPSTVTYNGNRNYNLVFNSTDLTGYISNGMRLKLTRTVTAPTQCTSLNGTTQYYSKSSPSGMTFTNNFTCMAWVKLGAYGTASSIITRYDGTTGFIFQINNSGQLQLQGLGTSGNGRVAQSYQSLPLNKWVHVAATMDMTGPTATMYFDGASVPLSTSNAGTGATALIQAGNLNVGATNGINFFNGKLAQVALFSAVLNQSTIQGYISQGLAGTETSLISAYSFNNSINDLNANANNLTANGSAVATNADSPFALGADASTAYTAGTTEYGIVTSISFSTNTTVTVQVPVGGAIPTSGGVSAMSYSTQKAPLGFPTQKDKWAVELLSRVDAEQATPTQNTFYNVGSLRISVPQGAWRLRWEGACYGYKGATGFSMQAALSTSASSISDSDLSVYLAGCNDGTNITVLSYTGREQNINLASSTTYYWIVASTVASAITVGLHNDLGMGVIRAECAHL